jgi:putative membrane protein insertion efficiency factor
MTMHLQNWVTRAATFALVVPVRFYQGCIRTAFPSVCRFYPSCSDYFIEAVQTHGPLKGACRGVWRFCRCHPLSAGGFDPP